MTHDATDILIATLEVLEGRKAATCSEPDSGWHHLDFAARKFREELKRRLTGAPTWDASHRHTCDCGDYRICSKDHLIKLAHQPTWVCPQCEDDQRHKELDQQAAADAEFHALPDWLFEETPCQCSFCRVCRS